MAADRLARPPRRRDAWISGVASAAANATLATVLLYVFTSPPRFDLPTALGLTGLLAASIVVTGRYWPRFVAWDLPVRILGAQRARPTGWRQWLHVWQRVGGWDMKPVLQQIEVIHGPSPIPWDERFMAGARRVRFWTSVVQFVALASPVLLYLGILVGHVYVGLPGGTRLEDVVKLLANGLFASILLVIWPIKTWTMARWCRWYLREVSSRPVVPPAPTVPSAA